MLNDLAKRINTTAHEHGWWDTPRSFGDVISLCHSELSEALESYRNGESMIFFEKKKPEGIAVEMIDCVIRIFDYLAEMNIDVDDVMNKKLEYNDTRTYRHGGKKL